MEETDIMLKLPAIFSDHMILQRRKPVVIWGESDARKVTVTIQDARVVTYEFSQLDLLYNFSLTHCNSFL